MADLLRSIKLFVSRGHDPLKSVGDELGSGLAVGAGMLVGLFEKLGVDGEEDASGLGAGRFAGAAASSSQTQAPAQRFLLISRPARGARRFIHFPREGLEQQETRADQYRPGSTTQVPGRAQQAGAANHGWGVLRTLCR
jgi:hypothetical protein